MHSLRQFRLARKRISSMILAVDRFRLRARIALLPSLGQLLKKSILAGNTFLQQYDRRGGWEAELASCSAGAVFVSYSRIVFTALLFVSSVSLDHFRTSPSVAVNDPFKFWPRARLRRLRAKSSQFASLAKLPVVFAFCAVGRCILGTSQVK